MLLLFVPDGVALKRECIENRYTPFSFVNSLGI